MTRLRVGIVGAGSIAELHALGYKEDERATIVAVCDQDEDAAIRAALDWGASSYSTAFAELLKNPDIDAIEILTPHAYHAPQVLAALRAGKHVSVERPLALTIEEADALMSVAAASGKVLHVYEPNLFFKPFLDARNLIDSGDIGQPTSIRVDAVLGESSVPGWSLGQEAWRFDEKLSGGSPLLFDIGYQAFAISLLLLGSVEKLSVWRSESSLVTGQKIGAPVAAMWRHFQQNVFGTLSMHYAPERKMNSAYLPLELDILVSGTRGSLHMVRSGDDSGTAQPLTLCRDNREVSYSQRATAFSDSFVHATKNFISACLGQEAPLLQASEAKQLLVLTLAWNESAKRGRAVTLQHG